MIAGTKTTNYFSPLFPSPYGANWGTYNAADVPVNWANSTLPPEQLARKLAYEWFQSNEVSGQHSNPPFLTGSAGRVSPVLKDSNVPRILRGYIRRANYYENDEASRSRLYFMFNPETITRDYVSYLDQAALDPFNTVFGSDNLVAPPSFMNFRFELFFDRGDELAQDKDHPGVFVDYQFFDLVVRNVVPSDPNGANNSLPDNGVMMVNPRDITVVFSPQLSVQGRPINAQVSFEKFSHRMTPTRMRISLEMRVVYIGPVKPATEVSTEEAVRNTTDTVAPDDTTEITFTFDELQIADGASEGAVGYLSGANPGVQTAISDQTALFNGPNAQARMAAYAWARGAVVEGFTEYDRPRRASGVDQNGHLKYTDCSALVWSAYNAIGLTEKVGWGGGPTYPADTPMMINSFRNTRYRYVDLVYEWGTATVSQARVFFANNRERLQQGDLLFREMTSAKSGHVVFFDHWEGNQLVVFAASSKTSSPQVGLTTLSFESFVTTYNFVVRPKPFGSDSYSALTNGGQFVGVAY